MEPPKPWSLSRGTTFFLVPEEVVEKFVTSKGLTREQFDDVVRRGKLYENLIAPAFRQPRESDGYIYMNSDVKFKYDGQTLDGMEIYDTIDTGDIVIHRIYGIPLTREQMDLFDAEAIPKVGDVNYLMKLTRDIFLQVLVSGDMSVKDIIGACLASKELNERCNYNNQQVFRTLLVNQFQYPRELANTLKWPRKVLERAASLPTVRITSENAKAGMIVMGVNSTGYFLYAYVVKKITPTGKIRIQQLEWNEVNRVEVKQRDGTIKTFIQKEPDLTKEIGPSILLTSKGSNQSKRISEIILYDYDIITTVTR